MILLDRERELDRLGVRLGAASAGEGGVVVVEGPPGRGKTSLLRAATREAERRGFEVARARGAELEGDWPFGVARQLLEPALRRRSIEERSSLLAGAAGLAAGIVLPETDEPSARVDATWGTLHGLYWLCVNLATASPLLLVVDDAQWADEASLRFLGMLARRIDALPVLLALAQRPAPPPALAEVTADPQVEQLGVTPLSPPAVQALLARWSPDEVEPEFAHACHAATGGNPFFLSRLAAGLRDQGVPFTAGNASRVSELGPAAVGDAVRATLARLPADTIGLADATTVLGEDVEVTVAAALAGLDEGAAETAAERLVAAGVFEDARPLRFVHAIVRDAVAASLSAGVRGMLHARAAELLDARQAAPDVVAAHLLATDPRGRVWVVERLAAAADHATARGSPTAAMTMLQRALEEPPDRPSTRAELLFELARSESTLGRRGAVEHFRAAHSQATDPVLRARAALELTWAAGPALDPGEVVPLIERSIGEVACDRELTLQLEAARLTAFLTSPSLLTSRWKAGEFQRWAQLEGATPGECLLLAQLALGQMNAGGPAEMAGDFAERASRGQNFDATGGGMSLMFTLIVLYKTDRLDTAERVLDRELRVAQQRGSPTIYALVCNFRGPVAMRRGALSAAEADFRAGLDAIPPDGWQRPQLTAGLVHVLVDTGQLAEAQALLVASGWDADLPDDRSSNVLLASRSRLRVAQGDPERGLADALEARRRALGADGTNWDSGARIASIHLSRGESADARREADALLASARAWGTPGAIGQALRTSGLVEGGERGLALLREAAEHLERSPARLEYAQAVVEHGAALRRRGDRTAAREQLRHGLDLAAAAGAHPLAERARQELAATGLRIRRAAQTGIASLTPSERRVAEHAAAGATNAEIAQALFVTLKTVEMHLGHTYRKLDISSRHQLAQHLPASPTE